MLNAPPEELKIALDKDNDQILEKSQKEKIFNQVGSIAKEIEVDDSVVLTGSMSLNKVGPNGTKKKTKKAGGIGGTSNLRKNKLAIAFNNIELEKHS